MKKEIKKVAEEFKKYIDNKQCKYFEDSELECKKFKEKYPDEVLPFNPRPPVCDFESFIDFIINEY